MFFIQRDSLKNRYSFIFLNTQQSYPPHQAIQFKWPIQYMYSNSLLSGISLISKWASTIPNRTSFLKFSSFLPHANYRYFTTKWIAKREREKYVNEHINNNNNNNTWIKYSLKKKREKKKTTSLYSTRIKIYRTYIIVIK